MEKEIQKTQADDGKLRHTSKEMVPVSGAVSVAEESQCPRLGQDTLRLEEEEKEKGEEEKGGEEKEKEEEGAAEEQADKEQAEKDQAESVIRGSIKRKKHLNPQ